VIGDPVFRPVVGADSFGSVEGADLGCTAANMPASRTLPMLALSKPYTASAIGFALLRISLLSISLPLPALITETLASLAFSNCARTDWGRLKDLCTARRTSVWADKFAEASKRARADNFSFIL